MYIRVCVYKCEYMSALYEWVSVRVFKFLCMCVCRYCVSVFVCKCVCLGD